MKLGLYGINLGPCADPQTAASVARAAEKAGFESLWTAEHVVLPDPQVPPSPVPAQTRLLDPAVALAHVAAHTRTIRLATGIIILPQRNPLVLAKEMASVGVTPSVPLDADTVRRFQEAGVDRLVPLALAGSAEDLISFVERTAGALLGAR